jgi:hypothetical protein
MVRISRVGDALKIVRWFGRPCMLSWAEIVGVEIISEPLHQLPIILVDVFRPKPRLKWIILEGGEKSLSLASFDIGFRTAISWVEEKGWKLQDALVQSLRTPYIRVKVSNSDAAPTNEPASKQA